MCFGVGFGVMFICGKLQDFTRIFVLFFSCLSCFSCRHEFLFPYIVGFKERFSCFPLFYFFERVERGVRSYFEPLLGCGVDVLLPYYFYLLSISKKPQKAKELF